MSGASRVSFFSHSAKEILSVDFSHARSASEVRAAADECRRLIVTKPQGTVRTLVDVTGTWFDKESIQVASDLASHNRPYVVGSAVIGVTGLLQIAFNAIVAMTKRNMRLFDTRAEALAWLASQ